MRRTLTIFLLFLGLIGLAMGLNQGTAEAQIGVGINVGNIQVDEPLFPGGSYHLPSVGVMNTGHLAGEYSLRIIYRYQQPELRPSQEWFSFEPARLYLEPGQVRDVAIDLRLPADAPIGRYFAFLEAYRLPSEEEMKGGQVVGVAAAAKLNFTVSAHHCLLDFQ